MDPGAYEYQGSGYCPAGGVFNVNYAATGAGNGLSWVDAYTDLEAALVNARGCEVWVAQGVYYPTSDAADAAPLSYCATMWIFTAALPARKASLTSGIGKHNLTVLSGDIDNNDLTNASGVVTATANIVGDNAYHVVVSSGVTETAVIDGFIITGGQANGAAAPKAKAAGYTTTTAIPPWPTSPSAPT